MSRVALILVLSVLFNVFPWFQAALIYIALERLTRALGAVLFGSNVGARIGARLRVIVGDDNWGSLLDP